MTFDHLGDALGEAVRATLGKLPNPAGQGSGAFGQLLYVAGAGAAEADDGSAGAGVGAAPPDDWSDAGAEDDGLRAGSEQGADGGRLLRLGLPAEEERRREREEHYEASQQDQPTALRATAL